MGDAKGLWISVMARIRIRGGGVIMCLMAMGRCLGLMLLRSGDVFYLVLFCSCEKGRKSGWVSFGLFFILYFFWRCAKTSLAIAFS